MGSFTTTHQITYISDSYSEDGTFSRTITDGDADDTFETGDTWTDPVLTFEYIYVGTAVIDGLTWPVFSYVGFPTYKTIFMDQAPVTIPATIPSFSSGATFNGACFAPGTLIATPDGQTPVETLRNGDLITLADGGTTSVRWIGVVSRPTAIISTSMQAVRINAGALGNGLPHSDLTVTADHGMVIDGLVINAAALVNDATINFVPARHLPNRVTYYHIETAAHDVILANGAPAETFMDAAGRAAFDNYQEYLELYGVERIIPEMPRPRINTQRLLPAPIKARLGIEALEFAPDFARQA